MLNKMKINYSLYGNYYYYYCRLAMVSLQI